MTDTQSPKWGGAFAAILLSFFTISIFPVFGQDDGESASETSLVLNDDVPVANGVDSSDVSTLDATVIETTPEVPVRGRGTAPVPNRFVVAETIVDLATPVENDTLNRARIDNPISVAQFSGSDLLLRSVGVDRSEVFNRTANATALPGAFGSFTIRGVNDDALATTFDTGSNNLATVFINQAPISKNHLTYTPPTLWDVERVEVFRGPQSIFQGPNSLAGAVFYDYVDPNFTWEGRSRVEYGEYDTMTWAVTQNVPIVDEVLAARFNYERYLSDGFVKNITRDEDDWGRTDRQNARLQLLYRPNGDDDTTLNFTYRYGEDRGNDIFPFVGGPTPFFDRTSIYNNNDVYDSESHFLALEGFFRLNDAWTLETVTSAQYLDGFQDFDGDRSPFPIDQVFAYFDEYLYTQEFRFNFDDGGPFRGLVGLYGQYNDYKNGFNGTFFGSPIDNDISEFGTVAALFLNGEYDVTNRLTVGAGVRFNYEERDVNFSSVLGPLPPFLPFPLAGEQRSTDEFFDVLPQGSISYDLSDTQTIGGLVSRGYRSGGVSVAPFVQQVAGYDPEYTWNYELFYRGVFLDGQLRVNSNVFYNDWTDQQVGLQVPGGTFVDILVENVGESTLYGAEFEVEYDFTREWSAFLALGYNNTEFGNFPLSPTQNLMGESFPFAPAWDSSLGVQYVGECGVFGSLTWTYQDESYSEVQNINQTALSSRHLVSAKLGYGQDNWKVYAFGSNLLNEDYELNQFDQLGIGQFYGVAGPPRVFGAGFELAW